MTTFAEWLKEAPASARKRIANALDQEERNEFDFHWDLHARAAQLAPPGDWRIWLIMAGRGFGKTRAGAEWVRKIAEAQCEARIALVSASLSEARAVMVEGESGILACSPPERRPKFEPSLRRLRWPNGAQAQLFSAAEPESLRGPQQSHACRALFCGPGCGVPAAAFTTTRPLANIDFDANTVSFEGLPPDDFIDGQVRFLDGPQTGVIFGVVNADHTGLTLDRQLVAGTAIGTRAELREGCDHTLPTCAQRFRNAVNFRGEPFLPGNDLLTRYGQSAG